MVLMAPLTTRRLSTAEVEHWKIDIDLEMEGFVELIISPRGRWPGQEPPVVTGTGPLPARRRPNPHRPLRDGAALRGAADSGSKGDARVEGKQMRENRG